MSLSPREAAVLARIDGDAILGDVLAWVAVNTGSRNRDGLARMEALLADAFAPLGTVRAHEPAPATAMGADGRETPQLLGRNLLVRMRPEAPTRVLLTGHYDTVFAADHPFQDARWLAPGVLNAPGAADMKGGIAIIRAAVAALADEDGLALDIVLNADEEVGSPGSAPLLAERAAGAKAALTFEPSLDDTGTLAGARPGSGNFSWAITGRSAHAGRNPQDGRNAVVAAADLALRLDALRAPDLKVNVARIEGGSANNVVPDGAVVRANLRPATPEAQARAEAAMAGAAAAVAAARDVGLHRHGGFGRPPKPLDETQQRLFALVQAAGRDLGLDLGVKPSGGVCDGNNIAACGVPVVDTMGGRGGAIHTAQEYLLTDSLAERARLAALVLLRLGAA